MRGNGIFSLLLLCSVLFIVRLKAQTMHLCPDQVEDSTCKIVCITPDHTQTVAYFKLPNTGTHIAQCVPSVGCFSNQIGYTITQPNATSTVLQFVLKRSLIGTYRCDYGSDTANDTLHWGTYPSDALVTGVTNGSEIASVDEFSVSLNCFYSQEDPTIILHYKDEQGNIDATSDLFSCTNSTNSSCPHDDAFTSYDCPCRLRHKTGIDCKDTYEVNGYITISNIDSMWNSRIVDEITFPCVHTSTLMPTTKQPPDQTCFLRFIDAPESKCIIIFVVVMVIIVGVVLPLICYVLCCRKRNKGNEAEKVFEKKQLKVSNKSEASERYVAMDEINDSQSSEKNAREGNANQTRSSQDDKESNSFTNENSFNKSKPPNEIKQDESARNTNLN